MTTITTWEERKFDFGESTEKLGLKDPSQPPPFLMPSKLLILHGEAKSECFTVGCVLERMFNYL